MLLPIARPGLFSRALHLPRAFSTAARMASATPVEDTIREKVHTYPHDSTHAIPRRCTTLRYP